MDSEILLYILKLVLGGIVSFLAIMLMSKTRDAAWMTLVGGFLFSYASVVFELMIKLGIFAPGKVFLFGMPLIPFIFAVVPNLFFISALIIMILRK